jgi:hypothetical protein
MNRKIFSRKMINLSCFSTFSIGTFFTEIVLSQSNKECIMSSFQKVECHMANHFVGITEAERIARLNNLDFTPIKRKLMEPKPDGMGWTSAQCEQAEFWYVRYLQVVLMYPCLKHVPNEPIDVFWHYCILDTRKYRADCEFVFGFFLDHYPYYGLNGDAQSRDDSFSATNEIYRRLFGEDCLSMNQFPKIDASTCGDGGSCGQGCSNGYVNIKNIVSIVIDDTHHNQDVKRPVTCGGQASCGPG